MYSCYFFQKKRAFGLDGWVELPLELAMLFLALLDSYSYTKDHGDRRAAGVSWFLVWENTSPRFRDKTPLQRNKWAAMEQNEGHALLTSHTHTLTHTSIHTHNYSLTCTLVFTNFLCFFYLKIKSFMGWAC